MGVLPLPSIWRLEAGCASSLARAACFYHVEKDGQGRPSSMHFDFLIRESFSLLWAYRRRLPDRRRAACVCASCLSRSGCGAETMPRFTFPVAVFLKRFAAPL